jgi:intracellular sulfur oxidation DsrE/DsrF family protein
VSKFGSSLRTLGAALSLVALAGCTSMPQETAQVKAAYHLTNGLEEAQRAIRNVRNHLNADPNAKIVVVGNGKGIDFMLEGAKDSNGSPFDASIQDLTSKGVEFRLCNNTIVSRKIDRSRVVPYVKIVPSGVAEVAMLQTKEGFAYVRP